MKLGLHRNLHGSVYYILTIQRLNLQNIHRETQY